MHIFQQWKNSFELLRYCEGECSNIYVWDEIESLACLITQLWWREMHLSGSFSHMWAVSLERGPCDLQPRPSGSRPNQAEHAVCELPAGRVRHRRLLHIEGVLGGLVTRGFSVQHHWHVWRIHSQPAVVSHDLWTKLAFLQSSHWAEDRNRLLFCSRVCTRIHNNSDTVN